MKIQTYKQGATWLILIDEFQDDHLAVKSDWFDAAYWEMKNAISGQAKGRFITWFINPFKQNEQKNKQAIQWVLRHYYRGGMVAKISKDSFFYSGIKKTRCYLEVSLLQKMLIMKLPVPKPIAARVIKKGLFYKADLLMEKLDATDLYSILKKRPLTKELWHEIGYVVARFHNKGIYHSDLNAHNIMLDSSNKVWLIDFDRCEQRVVESAWQIKNINRLERSFLKEKLLCSVFHFDTDCWQALKKGYQLNLT